MFAIGIEAAGFWPNYCRGCDVHDSEVIMRMFSLELTCKCYLSLTLIRLNEVKRRGNSANGDESVVSIMRSMIFWRC